jgi:NADPH:quinone reductase-like Zn-dependent oxidoreductase
MKAAVCARYGSPDVLQIQEVATPVPADGEVLIRVRAAALNPLDWYLMRGRPYVSRLFFGLRAPKISRPGRDLAGEVVAVGRNVTSLKPGDAVFGLGLGALAEYACPPERSVTLKPANMTFEQAAATPVAGFTALQGLRDKGHIEAGQYVLVNGASGGVGTFVVQIARAFGAHVTGVCSTRNVELVRSIGAERVIDYTQENFTDDAQRYDIVFDTVGNHSLSAIRRVLKPKGVCVIVGGPKRVGLILTRMLHAFVLSRVVSQTFVAFIAKRSKEDLVTLHDLMAAGKLTPVIDRCYPLSEVSEAVRHLAEGHARGKIVIALGP